WFEDLDQRSLEAIANAAVEQRFEPGQEIMRQGDVGVGAFIIRSGKVEVLQDRDGKQVKLATLGPGDVFGEMALLDEFPRSATGDHSHDRPPMVPQGLAGAKMAHQGAMQAFQGRKLEIKDIFAGDDKVFVRSTFSAQYVGGVPGIDAPAGGTPVKDIESWS